MRLWQKIFLTTLALMVLSTALISTLLLRNSRDALWRREGQRAVTQQQYLAGMLKAGVVSYRLQLGVVQLGSEETRQTAQQVLTQQALDNYLSGLVLLDSGGGTVYDSMPEDWGGALPAAPEDEPDAAVYELRAGAGPDRWYLVCAMPVTLESNRYWLGAVYGVGDLQEQLVRQALNTVALSLGLSLLGAGLLLALVVLLLRPLAALDKSARRIAAGNYDERLTPRGRDELAGLAEDMNALAAAVESRVDQLEQVAEERKVFIANLAHEMKTPLTSILGYADLLYLPKEVPEERRVEYARVISEEAKRLRSLSGKLLELITLGSANLVFEAVPLNEVADEVAVSLSPVLKQSGLTLVCRCPAVPVWMDRELFKSLLYNLLDNGRKASETGASLLLSAKEEGGWVTILVADQGRGIPEKELSKICEPFYMVDKSRSRKAGGSGLGLALCREIVITHRGKMSIKSAVGQGTVVTLRFPLTPPEAKEKEEQPHE